MRTVAKSLPPHSCYTAAGKVPLQEESENEVFQRDTL